MPVRSGRNRSLGRDSEELRLLRILPCQPDSPPNDSRSGCQGPENGRDIIETEIQQFSIQKPSEMKAGQGSLAWLRCAGSTKICPPQWRYPWGDYAALSYTWGSPHGTKEILVNGCIIEVRSNLECALRALRETAPVRAGLWLWIDALCINQDDLRERAQEVPRMRHIYKNARDVVIWLGSEANDSSLAMGLIGTLSRSCREGTIQELGASLRNDPTFLGKGCWKALSQLMDRPYWDRLWIIQEITMGKAGTPVLCGTDIVAWEDVFNTVYTFAGQHIDFFFRYINHELDESGEKTAFAGLNRNRIIHFTNQQHTASTEGVENLMPMLDLARKASATEPNDKVYGILGLIDQTIANKVTISYELPETTVYAAFARTIIKETQSLGILEQCAGITTGLPSWAPDWRKTDHFRLFSGRCNYGAGDKIPKPRIDFSVDGTELRCQIIQVGKIDGLGATYYENPQDLSGRDAMVQPTNCNNPYGTLQELRRAVWKTLVGDRTPQGRRAPDDYEALLDCPCQLDESTGSEAGSWRGRQAFEQVLSPNKQFLVCGQPLASFFKAKGSQDHKDAYPAMERMFRLHRSRRLGVITCGRLCLVSSCAHIGDEIAIIGGCPIPMILRTRDKGGYDIVGSAYVYGFSEHDDDIQSYLYSVEDATLGGL